jgi:hypothetical protein
VIFSVFIISNKSAASMSDQPLKLMQAAQYYARVSCIKIEVERYVESRQSRKPQCKEHRNFKLYKVEI